MKTRAKIDGGYNQMRWVVLLLAIAVVLPTVCLLWFMTQVVKNERLAVRQKLVKIYQERLATTAQKTDDRCSEHCKSLDAEESGVQPYQRLVTIVGDNGCDGLIIYGATGERLYPLLSVDTGSVIETSEIFADAWELELTQQEFLQAAALYEQKAEYGAGHIRLAALIGKSRCLAKLGKLDEAIAECKQVAFSPLEKARDTALLIQIGNARLLMLKFMEGNDKYTALFEETFRKLLSMVYATNESGVALPADHNLFLAQKAFEIAGKNSLLDSAISSVHSHMRRLMAAEELSIRFAEHFPTTATLRGWQTDRLQRLRAGKEVICGLYHKTGDESLLALLSSESIASALVGYENDLKDSYVVYRILDDAGHLITGLEEPEGEPFATASIGEHFPGWKVELYFKGGDVFQKAASDQIAVYIWTGVLVIVLILVAGGLAGRAVGAQIKVNKLKNDFIATVSHELKTPLASMRLLVDTLLEGSYRDQQQVTEYLELVSKENERLSRLIDNFLTFSRMERNKRAFIMAKTSPAAIVHAAAEAVKTKFANGRCKFKVKTDENLPDVLADQDAVVTVLVNLLDNAYKYSYDDKRIELRAFAEDGSVCFCVCDNGTGMSRRSAKKIFKRFYQVDRSLARHAEGCGLGLSIAKFIVDAHKGSINVESKPGEGSIFTVRLRAGT